MKVSRIVLLLAFVILAGVIWDYVSRPWSCQYRDVSTANGEPYQYLQTRRPPPYVIRDGHLLLRHHRIKRWPVLLAATMRKDEWTAEKIADLMARHPELKSMFPDPNGDMFGIEWLKSGRQQEH